jgi:MSHA pilin protein MshA
MKHNSKQQGFTLIELIVVIVILGILAVTAAPKFINFTTDARASTIRGLSGAMKGGMQIVYSKEALSGKETTSNTSAASGSGIATTFGYPAATKVAMADAAGVSAGLAGAAEFTYVEATGLLYYYPATLFTTTKTAAEVVTGACYVLYTAATSATVKATVTTNVSACDSI